jgi:sugar phosphate isomerase/epimerase
MVSASSFRWAPSRGRTTPADDASWRRWAKNIEQLAPLLQARGIEVMNASPASRIACFPKCSIEDGLRWAIRDVGSRRRCR